MRCLAILLPLLVIGCGQADDAELTADQKAILTQLLDDLPDEPAVHAEWIAEVPQQAHWSDRFLVSRLCIEPELGGPPPSIDSNLLVSSSTTITEATVQKRIPEELLPDHVRFGSWFNLCGSGTVTFSDVVVDDDTAFVYVTGDWWGRNLQFERRNGTWTIVKEGNWWA